jgi:hypothetical protein
VVDWCILVDFAVFPTPPCSLQVKNNIKNLVQINCGSVLNHCFIQRRLLRCFRNTISPNNSFPRCCTRCSSRAGWAVATIMRSCPLPPQPPHFRFLMGALRIRAGDFFGDGMVMEILQLKWFKYREKIAPWCGPMRRNNTTTKRCQQDNRFVPNFEQCFPGTSPRTYQKRGLQSRLAVELFYFLDG